MEIICHKLIAFQVDLSKFSDLLYVDIKVLQRVNKGVYRQVKRQIKMSTNPEIEINISDDVTWRRFVKNQNRE
jgi:hypothetical protein